MFCGDGPSPSPVHRGSDARVSGDEWQSLQGMADMPVGCDGSRQMYQQQISRPVAKPVHLVKGAPAPQVEENSSSAAVVVGVVFGLVVAAVAGVLLRRKSARRPSRAAFEDLAGLLRLS